MNVRVITTVTISIIFLTLAVTGILLYLRPYNYFVVALHIWSSVFFLGGTLWHFKNNFKVYRNHLTKKVGKRALRYSGVGFVVVLGGLMAGVAPFSSLIDLSDMLRKAGQPDLREYTAIDVTPAGLDANLELFIKAGSAYESEPQDWGYGITYTSIPQVVVWAETLDGEYLETIYATQSISRSDFGEKDGEQVRRPEALPYWSHSRGVQEDDGLYAPSEHNVDLDGQTGATPISDYQVSAKARHSEPYRLLVEVNRSYDFNDYYSRDRFPDDPIYSGDGSSGQPSLVYEAQIHPFQPGDYLFTLVGHGHHSGQNGELFRDLTNVTTAQDILAFIVATVK